MELGMLMKKIAIFKIRYQWIIHMPAVFTFIYVITFLFFDSKILSFILACISFLSIKTLKNNNKIMIKKKIEEEFKTFIYSLSSSLSVGRSFESAVKETLVELIKEDNSILLIHDIKKIVINMEANLSVEEAFDEFATKYDIESIRNFSKIISLSIKQGGSIHMIIEKTVHMIDEKNQVENELEVIITQKKFELFMLLSFVPGMIVYLRMVSSSFSTAMYQTLVGKLMMCVCLVLYLMSGYIGKRIVNIEI